MNDIERIELARAYVALSNAHRPELICTLFAERAVYRSANVGEFVGREAIAEMMGRFFARFPDVHWHASNYRALDLWSVGFEFSMTAIELATGDRVERAGSEAIEFAENGLVARLEVEPPRDTVADGP